MTTPPGFKLKFAATMTAFAICGSLLGALFLLGLYSTSQRPPDVLGSVALGPAFGAACDTVSPGPAASCAPGVRTGNSR